MFCLAEKITFNCKYHSHKLTADGGILITFEMPSKSRYNALNSLDDEIFTERKEIVLTAAERRRKRSINANDYLWVLCTALSEKLRIPKEEIYREHIRQMGVYEPLAILETAVDKFTTAWSKNGIGWFCEVVDSTLDGCKKIFAYYGSSTYDTKQMSILIDSVVQACKDQDIETLTPKELEAMKARWGTT